ncbi:hypothetical protein ALO40_200134 [Pseudomonas syringae pv. viburni]|uniref:Uncharacterized protein n=1 Tax=Pseudomonas syringae pv. viburni TaxID=251703 RepID=A0A0Q0DC13_9PSED|nr:hypothetical protein ALO40_200134 [Pseudomonas syringae pv. viburni]
MSNVHLGMYSHADKKKLRSRYASFTAFLGGTTPWQTHECDLQKQSNSQA